MLLPRNFAKIRQVLLLAVVALITFPTAVLADETLSDRIAPIGKTCLKGEDCAGAPAVKAAGGQSAESVYNISCMACHSTGAAGAPKLGDQAAWADRIAKGTDVLYTSAISGFQGMPPKGTCMSCSDDELKAVDDYMVEKSQ